MGWRAGGIHYSAPTLEACVVEVYGDDGLISTGSSRGAIEKSGNSCPLGFYSSGNYCVSSPSNHREAIQKSAIPARWAGLLLATTASKAADRRDRAVLRAHGLGNWLL
jgi:hypothetical protein